jgi:hypothetical protein
VLRSVPAQEDVMPDDKTKRGGRDRDLIALKEDYEVRYWTQALGVTKSELIEAVRAVGHSAVAVRRYLASHT